MSSGLFKQEEALLGKAKEGEAALDAEQYKVLLKDLFERHKHKHPYYKDSTLRFV